jgi:hypothetical protein
MKLGINKLFYLPSLIVGLGLVMAGQVAAQSTFLRTNVGTIFMIGFENHNFTQPSPFSSSPEQISNNPACPFLNSLITPGNSNATHVSFCTRYFNAGVGVHPSEPNYIWEEAGANLGILADKDPTTGNGNIFTVEHFTKQLDTAGISWKNYEEDVEYTTSTVSKSGTRPNGTNTYNGSTQYDYACKHNPMCFFSDSQTKNVYSLTNFLPDLNSGVVARYNWIMPNIQNCMHSATTANFTYHGTVYTGGSDQCAIAEGDNFLSIIIPKIMASTAFTNNGVIIIRFDETEGGDTTNYTIPEIIISPLAKGNAYASSVVMSHSSNVKTLEEIFGLNYTNSTGANYMSNSIASSETAITPAGTYNNIGASTVNDLDDLFKPLSPVLNIVPSGANDIGISWSSSSTNFILQNNSNLATTNWVNVTISINFGSGSNRVNFPTVSGNTFYRLVAP